MFLLSMLKTMVYVRCHYRRLRLPTAKRAHLPILMKYYTSNQRYHRQSCSTCKIWIKVQPVKYLQIKSHHYHNHYYQLLPNQNFHCWMLRGSWGKRKNTSYFSLAWRKRVSWNIFLKSTDWRKEKIGTIIWCFENWICKYVFTPFAI